MLTDDARASRLLASPVAFGFSRIISGPSLGCASGSDGAPLPLSDRVLAAQSSPHYCRGFSCFASRSPEDGNSSDDNNELQNFEYDPRCGMSKEEFEWRCAQERRVYQRTPQALHNLKISLKRMRHHFLDDPDALEQWDEYEEDLYNSFESYLEYSLSSLLEPPDSVRYKHIMKSKARSKSSVCILSEGMVKLRQAAGNRSVVVVGAIMTLGTAAGLVVYQWKKQRTKET